MSGIDRKHLGTERILSQGKRLCLGVSGQGWDGGAKLSVPPGAPVTQLSFPPSNPEWLSPPGI